ncbi:amidohydrolase family protein [Nocardioides sp. dk4132]|uniref:amidohydrolase family protein n=1 Tax=unclassified Nocardioides TaxID=2615069 RepID=UPI001295B679|nr:MULTISPECIES: amidohydrolase family protein [unclassified Nocardioides]MQW77630.1 amidohydrolase family protein [Nocardioides sp. dk4132]QGA06156.1 amidohydrolase family protein [Nocardioides sp. dk884]
MRLHLRDVEVGGRRCDVAIVDPEVVLLDGEYVASSSTTDELVVDGAGGALLPGLHDHHLHLLAMAAPSVDCGVAADAEELGALLRTAEDGWVRARGYHESIAGHLDRDVLDRLLPDRPVRVQHRSGALWVLNSAALAQVAEALDDSADVERDDAGRPTGRLWRYDVRLRAALPATEPDLAAVGDRLLRLGITGVTDATPELDRSALELLTGARRSGALPQRLTLLGAPDRWSAPDGTTGVASGPAKLLLRDHDLPLVETVAAWIEARHRNRRPVAVHSVSTDALALVLAALEQVGTMAGDRLEHGGVVVPGLRPDLARLGLRVVTNPGFVEARGDQYLVDVEPGEQPFLYPYASLLEAGIPVCPASDAPFGDPDPWRVIRAAAARRTTTGRPVSPEEAVPTLTALAGYLSPPADPGHRPRRLSLGVAGDVCLLRIPLQFASERPAADLVRLVATGGRIAAIGT